MSSVCTLARYLNDIPLLSIYVIKFNIMATGKIKFMGITIAVIFAVLGIIFFAMSLKIASKLFIYVFGSALVILFLGFAIYYIWKYFNKMGTDN